MPAEGPRKVSQVGSGVAPRALMGLGLEVTGDFFLWTVSWPHSRLELLPVQKFWGSLGQNPTPLWWEQALSTGRRRVARPGLSPVRRGQGSEHSPHRSPVCIHQGSGASARAGASG